MGDADLLLTILEMRSYARAKDAVDRAKSAKDLRMTPAVKLVFEVEMEALKSEQ